LLAAGSARADGLDARHLGRGGGRGRRRAAAVRGLGGARPGRGPRRPVRSRADARAGAPSGPRLTPRRHPVKRENPHETGLDPRARPEGAPEFGVNQTPVQRETTDEPKRPRQGHRWGEPVAISGFAKFDRGERKARTGRNPQTGETIKIKASKTVKVTPLKAFKDAVNKPSLAPKLKKGVYSPAK